VDRLLEVVMPEEARVVTHGVNVGRSRVQAVMRLWALARPRRVIRIPSQDRQTGGWCEVALR
jgi:hypothetical protein